MEKDKEVKKVLEVQITGKDKGLFKQLRGKLVLAISQSLDTVINYEQETTVKEEAKEFASALIDHAKAKLKKAGIENEKLLVEIDNLYVQREKEIAETRKLNAEAKAIEIQNRIRSLRLSLGGLKAMMIGEEGEEDLVFMKQIDSFLSVLNAIEG